MRDAKSRVQQRHAEARKNHKRFLEKKKAKKRNRAMMRDKAIDDQQRENWGLTSR